MYAESFYDKMFIFRQIFSAPGSNFLCHIIFTVLDFLNKNHFVFIVNAKNRTS